MSESSNIKDETTAFEMTNISKSFGQNRVLSNVNLSVKYGHVMGLMGENGAGKSTLMKILFGLLSSDSGEIKLFGKPVSFHSPKEALENGVAMVHQELNQCLDRNVLDNLFLGQYPTSKGLISQGEMEYEATQLFKSMGLNIPLHTKVRNLPVAQRQMIEVAKALSYGAKVIVFDEPTSSLTENEVHKLFQIITSIKKKGISCVFISHKMEEVFQVCDEVSVLRDGKVIMTKPVKETNLNELIKAMVGRPLTNRYPALVNKPGDPVLEVKQLSSLYSPFLRNISFNVRKGEIFGIYGLDGAGRTELLECLFGLRVISSGQVVYNHKEVHFRNANDAMKEGFALVTEERKLTGLYLLNSVMFNTCVSNFDSMKINGLISNKMCSESTKREVKKMNTKCFSINDPIGSLSGGNQQKVIIGRCLERDPSIFLMDEPTRGIDVGAKYEIYKLIVEMACQDKSLIVVSSDMPEILGITNRIAVLSNHRLSGIVNTKETTQEELLRLSAKYL